MLKLMDVESFLHIQAVRNLRGSRLPRGRALPPEEIRALFAACEVDDSSLAVRDAAMLAVILGCGLRRSEAVRLDLRDIVTQERALRILGKETRSDWPICRRAPGSGCSPGSTRSGDKIQVPCSPASDDLTP